MYICDTNWSILLWCVLSPYDLSIGRTSKVPSTMDTMPVVLISKGDHGSTIVHGFADSCKCLTIFDGKTDSFASSMPIVKKKFANTHAIRQFMQIDEVCKVFALVLENYASKGPHNYEFRSATRARSGYGKGTVHYIKPTSNMSAKAVSSFFKNAPMSSDTASPPTEKISVTLQQLNQPRIFCFVFWKS